MTYAIVDRWRLHRLRFVGLLGWALFLVAFVYMLNAVYKVGQTDALLHDYKAQIAVHRSPVSEASLNMNSVAPGVLREFIMRTNSKVYSGLADEIITETNRAAKKYGLSPALVMAIQKAESQFYPFALSNKKAKGLMQLNLESNGRELAERGIIKSAPDEFDPAHNIEGGCYLLRKYVDESGSIDKALNRYLGGESSEYKAEVHRALGQILILQVEKESGVKPGK